ncbi:hypothetical protein L204_102985 [Cryptococcus depauperatus]
MSLKHPKPLQVKLPFKVPRPTKSVQQPRACGICRKNDSKYTCPRCNVAYCSLGCFRNELHAQCSEPFYKATVLDSISGDPKVGLDKKRQMMEMLRRFEEAEAESDDVLDEIGSEHEDDELLEKLQGIDLDSINSNELFKMLPPKHQEAFIQTIQNPDSDSTKFLLEVASKDFQPNIPNVLPWWEYENVDSDEEEVNVPINRAETAEQPNMIPENVLAAIHPPETSGKKLVYNAMAIGLAYLHVLLSFRLPSLAPVYLHGQDLEPLDIITHIGQLVPFLVSAKSTVRHENFESAWTYVWEAIGRDAETSVDLQTLHHLLELLPTLLFPPITSPSHPKILLLLSDIYSLFARPPGRVERAVPRKLAFYARSLEQLERREWLMIESEVRKTLDKLEEEGESPKAQDEREGLKIV